MLWHRGMGERYYLDSPPEYIANADRAIKGLLKYNPVMLGTL